MRSAFIHGLFFLMALVLGFDGVTSQAQTNFWWTNGVDGAWNTPTGVWTNDAGSEAPPNNTGGSNDYVIIFQNPAVINSTNDLGSLSLNQLIFTGDGLTLWGNDLVFSANSLGALPQLQQNSASAITINNNLTLATNTTFAGSGNGSFIVNGQISGAGRLTLNGPYVLQLTSNNTYTGGTAINAGTLYISSDSNLGAAGGGLTLAGGGTLRVTNSFTFSNRAVTLGTGGGVFNLDDGSDLLVTNNFGGTANFTKNGAGTLTFAGAGVTFTNTALVNAGRLVFSNTTAWTTAVLSSNAPSIVLSNATVEFAVSSGTVNISSRTTNSISGVGTVIKSGAGTLAGLSAGTGGKTLIQLGSGSLIDIQGGTFQNGGWLPFLWTGSGWTNRASMNIASGAKFDLWDGNNVFINTLSGTGTVAVGGGYANTLYLGVNNGSDVFAGVITNNLALVKLGSGTQTLAGTNTYTGATTVNGGILQFSGLNTLPGAFTVNGGTLTFASTSSNTIGAVTVGAATANFNGFANAGALTLNGGTLSFTGTNTFSGGTHAFNSGTATIAAGAILNLTNASGAIAFGNGNNVPFTMTVAGTVYLGATGTGWIGIGNNSSGGLTNTITITSGGSMIVSNPGAQFFVGQNYTPGTTTNTAILNISGGTFRQLTAQPFDVGGAGNNAGINTGIVNVTSGLLDLSKVSAINLGVNNAAAVGIINLSGGAMIAGVNVAKGTGTGILNFNGGTLRAANNITLSGLTTVVVQSAGANIDSSNYTFTVNQNLGGPGALTKLGTGTLVLSSTNNNYAGGTIVSGGLLQASELTLGTGGLTLQNGGTFFNVSAIGGGSNYFYNNIGKTVTLGAGGGGFRSGWGSMTISGQIGGVGSLTIVNDNAITLTNPGNNYGGDTIIGAAGSGNNATLVLGANNVIPNGVSAGNLIFNASGSGTALFDLKGYSETINGLTSGGAGTNVIDNSGASAGTLTVGDNNANGNFGGVIKNTAGTLSLTKIGAGTLTLSGSNIFSGLLTVNNGAVVLAAPSSGGRGIGTTVGGLLVISNGFGAQNMILSNWVPGSVVFSGGTNFTVGALAGVSPLVLTNDLGQGLALSLGNLSATYDGNLSDAGANAVLIKNGSGIQQLTGINTYTGGTILNAGELGFGLDANIGGYFSAITFNGGVLQINGTAIQNLNTHTVNWDTFNGGFDVASPFNALIVTTNIAGSTVSKTGPGFLVLLSTNNTYATTLISNGTFRVAGGNNALATTSSVAISGGTYDLAGNSQTLSNLTVTGGIVQNGTITSTSDIDARAGLVSAVLTGNVDLVKTTAGQLTLLGNNTYIGTNLLNAGTLSVVSFANLGVGNTLAFNGGYLQILGTAITGPGSLDAFGTNINLDIANAANVFTLPELQDGNLIKSGAGTLVLSNVITTGTIVISGGTLLIKDGATLGSGNITNTANLTFNRSDTFIVSNAILGGGALQKIGTGTVLLNGPTNAFGAVTVTAGTLTFNAPASFNGALIVGNVAGDRGAVNVNTNVTFTQLNRIGNASGSVGAVYQSGGTYTGGNELQLGISAGSYGFYQLAGGTLNNSAFTRVSGDFGLGVFYQSGGTNVTAGNGMIVATGPGTGVLYMTAGRLNGSGPLNMGWGNSGGNGRGELNLTGGTINLGANGVKMNQSNANTDILNLNGGLLQANAIYKQVAGGVNIVNFNGATWQATAAGTMMGSGAPGAGAVDAAYVWSGGAFLDSSSFTVTIAQNLLAPTGNGVTNLPWGSDLTGYIGAPYVNISGGGGTGATAVALFDYTSGTVTGVLLTSPGVGYTNAPTVTLIGGGNTNVLLGTASLVSNPTDGALTKLGVGVLTLSGTNTYAGGTVVNNGLLIFNNTNALPSTGAVTVNSLGAVAFNWAGVQNVLTTRVDTASAGAIALFASQSAETIDFATAGLTNAFLGAASGNTVLFTGTFTPGTAGVYNLGGGNGTLILTQTISGTTLTIGTGGGTNNVVRLDGANNFTSAILNSNTTLSIGNELNVGGPGAALTVNGGTLQVRGYTQPGWSPSFANVAGNLVIDTTYLGEYLTVVSNMNVAGNLTKLSTGVLVLGGSNNFGGGIVTVTGGALNLQNNNALGGVTNITIANGTGELQLQGDITVNTGTLTIVGGGAYINDGALRNIGGTNTWAGYIVQTGGTRYNSDSGQLVIAGTLNNGGQPVVVGGNSDVLISGNITNTGALSKDGAGRLILSGTNTYTGSTTVNAGSLVLDFSATGAPANQIIATNSALVMNSGGTPSTLLVIGSATAVNTQTFANASSANGYSSIIVSNNGNAVVLNLGQISGNGNYLYDFTVPTLGGIYVNNTATNGLLEFATVGGVDFATVVGGKVTNYTAYTPAVSTLVSNNTTNVKIDNTSSGTVNLTNNVIINDLVANDSSQAHTVGLNGYRLQLNGAVTANPGVIMQALGSGGLTIGTNVNDGILVSGSWLFFVNNSASNMTINSSVQNGNNWVSFFGQGPMIFNGTNVGSGQFAFNGPSVTFNSTNTWTGATLVRGGTLTFSASSSNTLGTVTVGNAYGPATLNINGPTTSGTLTLGGGSFDRAVMNVNSNLTISGILFGNAANSAGAIIQNGGTLWQNTGAHANNFQLGSAANGYGYYRLNGGTLISAEEEVGGNGGGFGVFEQFGGTISNISYFLIGRTSVNNTGAGVANIFGGVLNHSAANNGFAMGWNNNSGIYSVLNVSNAWVNVGYRDFELNHGGNAGNIAIFNMLAGSTTAVNRVLGNSTALQVVNFNGGILQAYTNTVSGQSLIQGVSGIYIYSGGATIDTGTNAVAVTQNLVAPTGYGISSIAVSNGGGGYIGNPLIKITGGSGTGATAIAQIDFNTGSVTNILITSTGSGYLPNDAITVQMFGGGYTNMALLGAINWTTNATTGGLTKLGAGTLTFTGVNTYGGDTTISTGTLAYVSAGTNVLFNVSGSGALVQNGTGPLILNGANTYTGGTTINTGLIRFASIPTTGGSITIGATGVAAFDFTGINPLLTNINTVSAGVIALTTTSANDPIDFSATGANLSNAYLGAVGTVVYDLANHTPAVAGVWRLGGGGGTLSLTGVAISGTDSVTIGNGVNPGVVVFNSANTYSGGTTINSNNTLQAGAVNTLSPNSTLTVNYGAILNTAGNDQSIGSLAGGGILNNSATNPVTVTLGNNNTSTTFSGMVYGVNSLTKIGNGNFTLLTTNTFNGPTVVSAGTLTVLNGGLNGSVVISNGATLVASGASGSTGLLGEYFNNTANQANLISLFTFNQSLSGLTPNLVAATFTNGLNGNLDFNNNGNAFPPGYNSGTPVFQARMTGHFFAPTNGVYVFGTASDDGSMVYIDGAAVVTNNIAQAVTARYGSIYLSNGLHNITYAYNNTGGAYGFYTEIALPGGTTNRVPQSMLAWGNVIGNLSGDVGSALIVSNGTLTVFQTADQTFAGNLSSAATNDNLSKVGAATLTLSGTNSGFLGTIAINNGNLRIANTDALPTTGFISPNPSNTVGVGGNVNSPGGALLNEGAYTNVTDWLNSGRITTNAAGAIALTANSNLGEAIDLTTAGSGSYSNLFLGANGSITFNGSINPFAGITRLGGGGGTLVYQGAITNGSVIIGGGNTGAVVFDASNTYTGTTLISAGSMLQIGNADTAGTLGTGNVTNNALLVFNRTDTLTVNNLMVGAGQLQQNGSGSTMLATNNTYTGLTVINNGALVLGITNAVQSSTVSNLVNNGLQFGNGVINPVIGGLAGTGNIVLTNDTGAAVTLSAGNNNASTLYGGVISDNGATGAFVKVGTGALTLTNASTYTGITRINNAGGTLILSNVTGQAIQSPIIQVGNNANTSIVLQFGAPNQTPATTILSNAAPVNQWGYVKLMGNNQQLGGLVDLTGGGVFENYEGETPLAPATLTISNTANYTWNGYIRDVQSGAASATGPLSIIKNGIGTQTFAGVQIRYSGLTTINAGSLVLSNTTVFQSPITNNAALVLWADGTGVDSAPISGSGTTVKAGGGTFSLTGASTYDGITVSNGTLQIGNNTATGDIIGSVTNLATVALNRTGVYTNTTKILGGNLVMAGSGYTVLNSTGSTYTNVAINAGNLLFNNSGTLPIGASNIVINTGGALVNAGPYTTVTNWIASGKIATNATGAIALLTGGNNENIVLGNYNTLSLGAAQGNTATFLGSLTPGLATTNYYIGGGGGTIIFGNPNAFVDVNIFTNRSVVVGNGGGGTVVVLAPQNYTGGTIINAGTLSVSSDNALGYGSIAINSGGVMQITNAAGFATIKPITFNTSGSANSGFDVGAGSTATVYGAVSATGGGGQQFYKWGGGTLIFNGNIVNIASTGQRWAFDGGTTIFDTNTVATSAETYNIVGYFGTATVLLRGNAQLITTYTGANSFIISDQGGSSGTLTVQDNALLQVAGGTYVGGGTGVLNVNGGIVSLNNLTIGIAGTGTVNLNGGVLLVRGSYITKTGGTGNLNFNGGTLRAGNNFTISNTLNTAAINAGGAFIDSSNFTVTVAQNLSGAGVLTKLGTGTLILGGSNTYTGGTVINNGILRFNTGTIGGSGRNVLANFGGTAAGGVSVDSNFLSRVSVASSGTVAMVTSTNIALDFSFHGLTNVSLGAIGTVTNSGAITPFAQNYRLGGGGGTLVLTNNLTSGTNLVAFGSGSGGTLLLTGSNTFLNTVVNNGLVLFTSTNAMGTAGRNLTVNFGGTVAAQGIALNADFLGRITSNSAGVVALTAANSAPLDLSAFSSLSLGAVGTVTNSGAITPFGTTYRLGGGGGTLVITNVNFISGVANLVAFGGGTGGTLVLTTNNYSGGTFIGNLGTIQANPLGLGTGTVTNNGLLVINAGGTLSNLVSGPGQVWITGNVVTMIATNTYTGDTVVQGGGTLYLTNATSPAIAGNLVLSRTGTSAGAIAVRTLALNQMTSNAVLTLTQNSTTAADIRYSMQGNNQIIGGLSGNIFGAGGNLIVESATDGSLNMPATLTINVAAGASYAYVGTTNYLRNSAGGANSLLSLVKDGNGTQVLGGPQITYSGATTVKNGILVLSNTTAFASAVTVNGGALQLMTATAAQNVTITNNVNEGLEFGGGNTFTIGGLAGTGGITLWSGTGGGVALTVGGNNQTTVYRGVLSDAGPGNYFQGSLTKIGTGTLTLSNNNTYSGPTVINNGTIKAAVVNALPTQTALTVAPNNQGVFDTAGFNQSVGSLAGMGNVINSTANPAVLTVGNNNLSTTFSGSITGSNGLTKVGSGTLTMAGYNGSNTYTGATIINGGAIKLQGAQTALTVAGAAYWLDAAAAGSVLTNGSGQATQWNDQSGNGRNFTGQTGPVLPSYVTNALNSLPVLRFAGGNNITSMYLNASVSAASVFILNRPYAQAGNAGLWGQYSDTYDIRMTGANGWAYTSGNGNDFLGAGGANGAIYINGAATNYWGATLSTPHLLEEIKTNGAVTMANTALGGNYTGRGYTGDVAEVIVYSTALTDVQRQAVESYLMYKWLGIGAVSNVLPGTTALAIGSGAALDLNGVNQTVGSLANSGSAGGIVTNTAGTLSTFTVGAANTDTAFSGAIQGAIALTKLGTGNQILSGTNTYTGATLISAGTLTINGRLENSPVTANIGGTLAGDGFIAGSVAINNGATLSPGGSVGTLTVGDLTLTNGVKLVFDLGPTNASDKVIVNNALSLGGMDTNWFVLSAVSGFEEGTYTLFDATSITGLLGSETNFADINGYTGYLWLDDANHDVKLTVVPEPGTGTLVGAGLLAMFLLGRLRRGRVS